MDYRTLGSTGLRASVIGLGTWVAGGWMWGGADDGESLAAIRTALDAGINLIDTAPIYGHGHSEALVGRAVAESGRRDRVILATKTGLEWDSEKTRVWRNSAPARILAELEESLRRLRTDRIELYQIHWPDPGARFEDSMAALVKARDSGKIRFIGVSNFSVPQIQRCLAAGPVHTVQPPYNLFERGIEETLLPFCSSRGLAALIYSPLCRGLLTGKYRGTETFAQGDVRAFDPKFRAPALQRYVACVDRLAHVAARHNKTPAQLAIRWCLDQAGVTVALCGARRPEQVKEHLGATGWTLPASDRAEIERLVAEMIPTPIGPEFMGPP
jgi:aryl-alcohol dehydrogenase-like predicted oxidoreductase